MKSSFVPPSGNTAAKLAICGEQPGYQEVRLRRPFVGPAGQGLDDCLAIAKISRQDVYLTNVIKDLDENLVKYINLDSRGNSTISVEGYQYIKELGEELSNLEINAIVACGNIALLALTNRVGITKWRGSVIESTLVSGLKVIPTFHPATFIPPKFNFLNKPLIVEDLVRAKNESEYKELRRTSRNIVTKPSFDHACQTLEFCYEQGLRGRTIDIDIEVINRGVDCIAFAWSTTESICIPFRNAGGDYFTADQEHEIMLLIAKIMQSQRISKRGANFIFDTQFLFHKYGMVPRGELHCTQIAQKILLPDYPAGLDFVTTAHTDIPYYKADGKQWMKMGIGTWDEWWNYNGMDAIATAAAHPVQMEELKKQGNLETYERQRKLIKPLIYMAERGIKIDVQGMLDCKNEEQAKLDELAKELNEEVGWEEGINYNSPQQLMKYFYEELGIKPYKKKNYKGQYVKTTDVDALKRIARRGYKAAQIMLDIRGLSKRISTYLNIGKVEKDGRYRSSYKPVGAETGRLSSGETIFGTGGNQQNWPHDLLRYFVFDEGYIGYSFDLSQIENRIVAYVGGVISQIEAFERGIDLHRMTASVITNKPYNEISDEAGSSPLGDGRQSERYWGKKGNHAVNYDVRYKKFALVNELKETESKDVLERIHRGYPQIRNGYHIIIQNMIKKDRTVTNLMGRRRLFLGPVFQNAFTPKSACEDTFREGYAHLPQSTTADKINEHGLEFIYYNQQWFRPIELLAQIHDAIVFQVPISIGFFEHAVMLLRIKESLEQPLYWHGTRIDTPADLSIGLNMCKDEMVEIKSKNIPLNPIALSHTLEQIYSRLTGNN
jgi:uracil-DNA glycosylase family 4